WGDQFDASRKPAANIWNGQSHLHNTLEDGFLYTAPVRSFPPNSWSLYDVIGNVFEYCSDVGVDADGMQDPKISTGRGGSWWCSAGTCDFYNLVDIGQMDVHGALCNQGFRVART